VRRQRSAFFVVVIPGASYLVTDGLTIDGSCTTQNTVQIYADHATLDHDDVTNRHLNAGFGIHLYADAQSTLVERNVVEASGNESGIVFGGSASSASSGNVVRRNIFSGNAKYGASSSRDGPIGNRNVLEANCFWETPMARSPQHASASSHGGTCRPTRDSSPRPLVITGCEAEALQQDGTARACRPVVRSSGEDLAGLSIGRRDVESRDCR
jgi:Right handed beta helix region